MSTEWLTVRLGDVITLQRGFDLPSNERAIGSVPVVSSSGISGTHSEPRVLGPGVVTGRYGTIGQVFYVRENFWPLNTTLFVKDFKGNDRRFIHYLLSALDFTPFSDKSSVPGVNRNHLHALPIAVPPLPTQRAIARVLGAMDDKIELNRRMNATLEELARTIFRSWFVAFDPVRAKAEGRAPFGMDAATAALFPDHFVPSVLGDVPAGWTVGRLEDIFAINPKRTIKKGTLAPYLDMGNMPTSGARALTWHDREVGSGSKFQNGDVLLARITPCLENGKSAYVDFLEDGEVGWGSTEYIVLRATDLPEEFAYFVARDEQFRQYAIQNMNGSSGRQRVSSDALRSYLLVVPPLALARSFQDLVSPVFAMLKSNDEQSQTLGDLRDTLLPKLLSGEITVRAAEREVVVAT